MENNSNSNNTATFPREIEVTLKFTIQVNTQDEVEYYLATESPAAIVNKALIADIFNDFLPLETESLLKVNGLSYEEIQKYLNAEAGL